MPLILETRVKNKPIPNITLLSSNLLVIWWTVCPLACSMLSVLSSSTEDRCGNKVQSGVSLDPLRSGHQVVGLSMDQCWHPWEGWCPGGSAGCTDPENTSTVIRYLRLRWFRNVDTQSHWERGCKTASNWKKMVQRVAYLLVSVGFLTST